MFFNWEFLPNFQCIRSISPILVKITLFNSVYRPTFWIQIKGHWVFRRASTNFCFQPVFEMASDAHPILATIIRSLILSFIQRVGPISVRNHSEGYSKFGIYCRSWYSLKMAFHYFLKYNFLWSMGICPQAPIYARKKILNPPSPSNSEEAFTLSPLISIVGDAVNLFLVKLPLPSFPCIRLSCNSKEPSSKSLQLTTYRFQIVIVVRSKNKHPISSDPLCGSKIFFHWRPKTSIFWFERTFYHHSLWPSKHYRVFPNHHYLCGIWRFLDLGRD